MAFKCSTFIKVYEHVQNVLPIKWRAAHNSSGQRCRGSSLENGDEIVARSTLHLTQRRIISRLSSRAQKQQKNTRDTCPLEVKREEPHLKMVMKKVV